MYCIVLYCIVLSYGLCVRIHSVIFTNKEPHWLTLRLLMSYIYMELLVKPEILTSYIYGPTFVNTESRLFLFAAKCFNAESVQKVSSITVLCKHFTSYQGYPNYRWDLIRYTKG